MKRLEAELGVKLFTHAGTSARLTNDGQRILQHTQLAEYAVSRAATKADTAPAAAGQCRIMAGDGVNTYWLPQFFSRLVERHPGLDIALVTTQERFEQKRPPYDLRLQYMEGPEDHVCVRLGSVHFTLFASQEYLKERGMPAFLSDLVNHRLIDLTLDITEQGVLSSWTGIGHRVSLLTNSNGALSECVRYGAGIALLPTYAALLEPEAVAVLPEYSRQMPLFASFEREAGQRMAVRTVIDFLRNEIFNPKSMPWFTEDYQRPTEQWHFVYRDVLGRSAQSK